MNKKYQGAATIILTSVLLVVATFIVIFAGGYTLLQQKISANEVRSNEAYAAAEAGLEYGIVYLQANKAAILASPNNGFIRPFSDINVSNVTLQNFSKFTITYSNPIAYDYTLINVLSVGTNAETTATTQIRTLVKMKSIVGTAPVISLATKGSVSISGNSQLANTSTNKNILAGGNVLISGSGQTTTSTGITSNTAVTGSDITQNVASISSLTDAQYFNTFFKGTLANLTSLATLSFTNSVSTTYNAALANAGGKVVYINQTAGDATINGNTTIGSPSNPVFLIVKGDLNLSGNVTIYGLVYVDGSTSATSDITGNVTITGGVISTRNISMSGNTQIIYDAAVLNNVVNNSSLVVYPKVPGSWRDF